VKSCWSPRNKFFWEADWEILKVNASETKN
jgi:hypothetical protein